MNAHYQALPDKVKKLLHPEADGSGLSLHTKKGVMSLSIAREESLCAFCDIAGKFGTDKGKLVHADADNACWDETGIIHLTTCP